MNNSVFNEERPLIMHIDLNSCFATVEQQARPMLRGKQIAIINRRTEHTAIITASYEAKAMGVKAGMKLKEARLLCPDIIAIESDPSKYRFVYHKLLDIMNDYSAHVTMKSIDEGIVDFHNTSADISGRDLIEVGLEIKQRLKDEIGVWMRCNVGIATNRFLAKTAAGLHKPDGLDVLTSQNIRETLREMKLTDLTGIAHRNQERLNSVGIFTPLPFYSDQSIYAQVQRLMVKAPTGLKEIGIHCYELVPIENNQISLFADQITRERYVVDAIDDVNKRYGERTLHSANTLSTGIYVSQKIPFGSTRYL